MNLTPSIGICIACEKPAWPVCRRCTLPVPLPPSADHYAVLQINRRLHLDLAVLGDQMVRFTQFLNPRRFAKAGPEAQHVAELSAAAVKRAYNTLRDPALRAEYWLSLLGDAPAGPPASVPDDVTALLAAPGSNGEGITAEIAKRITNLRRLFHAHDEADDAERAIHLSDIRREAGLIAMLRGV